MNTGNTLIYVLFTKVNHTNPEVHKVPPKTNINLIDRNSM